MRLCCALFAAALVEFARAGPETVNATDAAVRIIGRGQADGDGGWVFDWPNTFILNVTGADSVTASITAGAWARFRVFLKSSAGGYTNGRWAPAAVLTVAPGTAEYVLASGLGDDKEASSSGGQVTVVLAKMNEADYNEHDETDARVTVKSFSAPGASIGPAGRVPGLAAAERRLEFIGDSITAAYGVGGTAPCTARPWMQDGHRSYAFLACGALGAECHVQSWSGRGLVLNYEAEEPGDHMPVIERRVWAGVTASPEWDFSSWVPAAVWVNLGTNDQCCGRHWPVPGFQDTYIALLTNITRRYARQGASPVPILAAVGPMAASYGPQVRAAAAAANAAGARVAVVDQTGIFPGGSGRVGCSGHPSAEGQAAMAEQAVAAIANATGWAAGPLDGETPAGALQNWWL